MSHTIVVIEDAPHVQLLIGQVLGSIDAEIVAAADGLTGLARVKELVPNLVILDLALPGINGWEVLQLMRATPETASIPVVVVTAHGQSGMAASAREGGAEGFFEKPFRPGDLRDRVLELLEIQAA